VRAPHHNQELMERPSAPEDQLLVHGDSDRDANALVDRADQRAARLVVPGEHREDRAAHSRSPATMALLSRRTRRLVNGRIARA
jgi:hypothetical protein